MNSQQQMSSSSKHSAPAPDLPPRPTHLPPTSPAASDTAAQQYVVVRAAAINAYRQNVLLKLFTDYQHFNFKFSNIS